MAEEEKKVSEETKKSGGGLKFIIILVSIVILAELGVVSFVIMSVKNGDKKEKKVEKKVEEVDSLNVVMEYTKPINVLVNVKGTNGDRYFKATLVIEYNATKYPMLGEFLTMKLPIFKDITINILSSKDINVLENYKLRDKIRAELFEAFVKEVPKSKGKINNVLINDWLIQ